MFSAAISTLPQLSYFGLFLFLAGGAIFIPIPEEVTLLTAGYLVAIGVLRPLYGIPLAMLGMLAGDIVLFLLAKFGASYAQKLRDRVNKMGLEKTWIFSPTQPLRAVFLLRFITGFRFIAPIYAGFEEVSIQSYVLTDIASILIYTPIMFLLGYEFHHSIIAFIAGFELVRHAALIVLLAVVGGGVLPGLYSKFKNNLKKSSNKSEVDIKDGK
jgi:membrane-associated protein